MRGDVFYIREAAERIICQLNTRIMSTSDVSAEVHPYQLLAIDERVKRVLKDTPLFDGHNDLPQQPRACFHGKIHGNEKFDLEKGFQRGMCPGARSSFQVWYAYRATQE